MNRLKSTSAALLATLALAALASCTSESDDLPKGAILPEGAVHLTASIAGTTATRAVIDDTGKGTFADGDTWGMHTLADGKIVNDNLEYTYGTTILYWEDLSRTDDVTFLAHYPRQASVADPAAYDFDVAAAATVAPGDADLLTASATGNRATNTADHPLTFSFEHRMHSLRINLTAGTGVPPADLATAQVTLQGMKSTARLDLTTGNVDPAAASGNTPYPAGTMMQTPAGQWYTSLIVAPQAVTTGADWLQIRLGNDVYIYKVPATLTGSTPLTELRSGYRLTLNLTLIGKHTVELTSGDIAAWGNQGNIDGSVDLAQGARLISTVEEFVAALTADGGGVSTPMRYLLGADIVLTNEAVKAANGGSVEIQAKGYKALDGDGRYAVRRTDAGVSVKILSSGASSLKLTRVTLADEAGSSWFYCNDGADWTLGDGVKVTSNGTLSPINFGGGTLTLDGATFTGTAAGFSVPWIAVANTRGITGTLVLNDFTFASDGDYISIQTNASIRLRPGMGKRVHLGLQRIPEADFAITPTAGAFTADDAARLVIQENSTIRKPGESSLGASGRADDYAFVIDPADGAIRLARKAATADELKAALEKASTNAGKPTRILLTADITVPEPTSADATYILDGKQYIEIDGGADGHKLMREGTKPIFQVKNGASLRLSRLTMDGQKKDGNELITVGESGNYTGELTLGSGFRLTGAQQATNGINANGIWVYGTLVMEDGAEITGNGNGSAVRIDAEGTLHLKGGKISGNTGYSLYLDAYLTLGGALQGKATVTVDNALPAGSAFDMFLDNYADKWNTVTSGAESVITVGGSYTAFTDADFSRFNLKWVGICGGAVVGTGFALQLSTDRKTIKLVATP